MNSTGCPADSSNGCPCHDDAPLLSSALLLKPNSRWVLLRCIMRVILNLRKDHAPLLPLSLSAPPSSVPYSALPSTLTLTAGECIVDIPVDGVEQHHLLEQKCPDLDWDGQVPSRRGPNRRTYSCSVSEVRGDYDDSTTPLLLVQSQSFPPYSSLSPRLLTKERLIGNTESQGVDNRTVLAKESRDAIQYLVQRKDLNLLKASGGVERVASLLGSNLKDGIDIGEHEDHQDSRPSSCFVPVHSRSYFHFLFEACNNYIVILLSIAAGLIFATGFMEQGLTNGWHDGVSIVAAIFILVSVPSVENFRREKKMQKELSKKRNLLRVNVRRSGRDRPVEISKVLEGDVVKLETDSIIPGDGLFIDGDSLVVDDVLNPGINRDHNPFLFLGSRVTSGSGTMLVTSPAIDADALLLKKLTAVDPSTRSSLIEDRIGKPHTCIEYCALCLSLVIAFIAFIHVLKRKHDIHSEKPDLKGDVPVKQLMGLLKKIVLCRETIPALASSLTVMMIGLQHGVPLVISLTLTDWNSKVTSSWIQNSSACATMGLVTVLYVDTTCGLICEKMEVTRAWIGETELTEDENEDSETENCVLEALYRGIEVSAKVPEISASPRNDVLVDWANSKWLLNKSMNYNILDFRKLSSSKKGSGTLMISLGEEEKLYMHWKGDASSVLDMCSHYFDKGGISYILDDNKKHAFDQLIKNMEETGLIMIAFAGRQTDDAEITEDGLCLLAILGLRYILPDHIKQDLTDLKNAGVKIILASEDKPSTLKQLANELGIVDDPTEVMETVREGIKPEQNQNNVKELKELGHHVVAFYGGSTGSIPALKEADLGITEISKSTQMAKESADIVLTEGLVGLVQCLKFGRRVNHNIQVFTELQLSTWISWLLVTLVTTIFSGDSTFTSIQQIWINLIMCFLGGLMMRMSLRSTELIAQKPAKRTEALVGKTMLIETATSVSCQVLVFLLFMYCGQAIPSCQSNTVRKTMIFTSFALCQVFNQVKAMYPIPMEEFLEAVYQHYQFLLCVEVAVAVQMVVVQLAGILGYGATLSGNQWMLSFALAVLPLFLHSAAKFLLSIMSNMSLHCSMFSYRSLN